MHMLVDMVGTKFLMGQGKARQAETVIWEHVFESIFLLQKSSIQRLIPSPATNLDQVTWVLLSTPAFCATSETALL